MKWETVKLGDLIHIKHGWAFKGEYFGNEGELIILTPGNFYEKGGFRQVAGKEKFYHGEFPEEFLLKKDDLVIAMTEQGPGLLGSPALVPGDDKYLHNQRIGLIKATRKDQISFKYMYYLFFTSIVRNEIFASATGTKVKHTAPKRIYEIEVPLPPLPTQRRIAAILSAYDDLIENNVKRIKLLEEKTFLRYKEIVRGEVLEEKVLGNIATINGESLGKSTGLDSLLYIDISSVTQGCINSKTEYDLKEAPGRARRVVKHQDIIWSCVRPNRKSYAIIWEPEENLIVSTGFAVITSNQVSPLFLYHCLSDDSFVQYLENNATGSAYPAVSSKDFEKAKINLPSKGVLEEYQLEAEPMFQLIHNLQKQNAKLREARDILLPRLMSGELVV